MTDYGNTWLMGALEALRVAIGADGARLTEAEWKKFDAVDRPVVTIFGAYDSGKSTLLKRLLVDVGVAVPDWLSISARRETFEANHIDALGCRFQDTPGIAGGNAEHEELARTAVALSDVIMLVLPPQLLTGDRDAVLSVLSGEVFRHGGMRMQDAVLTVIAKLDEGPASPEDDPEAYADYLALQRRQWLKLIEAAELDLQDAPIFLVAADPFQLVENKPATTAADYGEAHRAWDGVSGLVAALASLPERLQALRAASHRRFLCVRLEEARHAATGQRVRVAREHNAPWLARERVSLIEAQLDALQAGARATLDGAVSNELTSATRARLDSAESLDSYLQPRLTRAIDLWWDTQAAALQRLIDEAGMEVAVATRDGACNVSLHLKELHGDVSSNDAGKPGALTDLMVSSLKKTASLFKAHREVLLGMPIAAAQKELAALQEAGNIFETYKKDANRAAAFKTEAVAKSAGAFIAADRLVGLLPVIAEFAMLVAQLLQNVDANLDSAKQARALRELAGQRARLIADQEWANWLPNGDGVRAMIRAHVNAADAMLHLADVDLQTSEAVLATLGQALELD